MQKPQSFANHRAIPHPAYLLAAVVIAVETVHRGWVAFSDASFWNIWTALVWLGLLQVWYTSRRAAQIVQDRVIRLEMRLRFERLFGAARLRDFEKLELPQIIALRFASDAELPALVESTLAGKFAKPDDIKRAVRDWQADWLRV